MCEPFPNYLYTENQVKAHNDVVVVDLNDDDRRISDQFLTQSVHNDVVKNQRLAPRRAQSLRNKLHSDRQINIKATSTVFKHLPQSSL